MQVNVSARQFQHPDFVAMVSRVLQDTGVAHDLIELELTESLLIAEPDRARATLDSLKALGVQVSIDDFGTGFSSLDRLRRLPVDYLKIDRGLIADLAGSERDRAIVSAVAALGEALGITVVAEGVETAEQAAFFSGATSCEVQGFLYCKPLPAAHAHAWCAAALPARGRGRPGRSGPDAHAPGFAA